MYRFVIIDFSPEINQGKKKNGFYQFQIAMIELATEISLLYQYLVEHFKKDTINEILVYMEQYFNMLTLIYSFFFPFFGSIYIIHVL